MVKQMLKIQQALTRSIENKTVPNRVMNNHKQTCLMPFNMKLK